MLSSRSLRIPRAQPQAQPRQHDRPQPQGTTAGATGAAGRTQQKKEIKDPAEYNAYVGAVQQADPAAKISGLEAFLTQYPNSVMKEDALEILMGTYQQKGDPAKMGDTAQRLLQLNPNNVRALALLAYSKRIAAHRVGRIRSRILLMPSSTGRKV